MSSVRGRRGGPSTEGHRVSGRAHRPTGRVPRVHSTRPVRTGLRSTAASRPGQRRSGRRPARSTAASARRRPLFTGRAILLGALILLLALTLAGPVRQYLAGRAELVHLAAEGQELDHRVQELRTQLAREGDPAYTQREARERLTYVLPGDRLVVVVDGKAVDGEAVAPAKTTKKAPSSWYEGLLDSLRVADGGPGD
jgi:cell division protein FtsB